MRPTVVSLFSGAGGLDLGLERAGFQLTAAVECDADCVATLSANQSIGFPSRAAGSRQHLRDARLIAKRVEDVDADELRPDEAGRNWVPDLLAGGPPCQPFSSAGNLLSLADPRGMLFEQFVRLAAALRPRLILFENVRGLITARGPGGDPGEALFLVKEAFEAIGYATTFALLNAADYGSAQRRVRCFLLASRASLPQFPSPTHAETPSPSLFEARRAWVSLGEFLASQPAPDAIDVVRPTPALAERLAALAAGAGLRSAGAREATRPGGHWGYRQGTFVADLSLPARTVTASGSQDWIRLADGSLRRLTWRECAALQGFPPEWHFHGGKASRFRQIGNAVPVVFGEVLGACLLEALRRGESGRKSTSAPLPAEFVAAMNYTRKEQRRNGASRRRVIRLQKAGRDARRLKGTGSTESKGA